MGLVLAEKEKKVAQWRWMHDHVSRACTTPDCYNMCLLNDGFLPGHEFGFE